MSNLAFVVHQRACAAWRCVSQCLSLLAGLSASDLAVGHKGRMFLARMRRHLLRALSASVLFGGLTCPPALAQASGLPSSARLPNLPHPAGGTELKPADWLALLGPQPMTEAGLAAWVGRAVRPELESGPKHYLVQNWAPYAGGVDLYLNARNEVEEALFYLVSGPLFTMAQVAEAKAQRPLWQLFDVQKALGHPHEVTASQSTRSTRWTYQFPAGRLVVQSLPESPGIHRVVITRTQ